MVHPTVLPGHPAGARVEGVGRDKWALALEPFHHPQKGHLLDVVVKEWEDDRDSVTLAPDGVRELRDHLTEWLDGLEAGA